MPEGAPLAGCRLIDLPTVSDRRGRLTVVEQTSGIPFGIQRLYYVSDVPADESRAGHAHRALDEVVIALRGELDIVLSDGVSLETIRMNRSDRGLHIPPLVWHELKNVSPGAIVLGIASLAYDQDDYYRDYEEFLEAARRNACDNTVR